MTDKEIDKTLRDITARFGQVYPALKAAGTVNRVDVFLKNIGINHRSNYYKTLRGERALVLQHVVALIEIYKVYPDWLFFGKGNMFADKPSV